MRINRHGQRQANAPNRRKKRPATEERRCWNWPAEGIFESNIKVPNKKMTMTGTNINRDAGGRNSFDTPGSRILFVASGASSTHAISRITTARITVSIAESLEILEPSVPMVADASLTVPRRSNAKPPSLTFVACYHGAPIYATVVARQGVYRVCP